MSDNACLLDIPPSPKVSEQGQSTSIMVAAIQTRKRLAAEPVCPGNTPAEAQGKLRKAVRPSSMKVLKTTLSATPSVCDGAQMLPVRGIRQGRLFRADDWIAEEVPVALEFNGISHAVMLATPLDLEEFALGFALSEGIISAPGELYAVDEEPSELGITLKLRVASAAFERLKSRRRSLTGRTGCGLCGTESLTQVARDLPVLPDTRAINRMAVAQAMSGIFSLQDLQRATGAVHAAAWCSPQGDVMSLREDVGRHNALDKLIGSLAADKVDASTGFIAVTSRASFEMVQKTASAGVALLAAVSAPTSLAIKTAQRLRMTLVGFARQQDLVVYSHEERLDMTAAPRRLAPIES